MSARDEDERSSSPYPRPLSSAQIADAVRRSSDTGATIILSKLRISDIGALEAEELASAGGHLRQDAGSVVERLALASNRLYQLPQEFTLFTKLRYLNLKHNAFTVFPDVLTRMVSLDTLDISHNKIQSLPQRPGNLIQLKVLCLSRNKIQRLPSYIAQFRDLEVLQLDRNPIDWSSELAPVDDLENPDNMRNWIRNLQASLEREQWINSSEYDDSGYGERMEWDFVSQSPAATWRFPPRNDSLEALPTPHAKSFSIDSKNSGTSLEESLGLSRSNGRSLYNTGASEYQDKQGDRFTEITQEDSYTASPISTGHYEEAPEKELSHFRASSQGSTSQRQKQSWNALRDHANPSSNMEKDLSSSFTHSMKTPEDTAFSSSVLPFIGPHSQELQDSRTFPFVAAERNSYFRRSSSVTIHENVPKVLIALLECARSILFAAGQLYQTLEQFAIQITDGRSLSMFKKVLEPANMHMLHLIRSLDRFDDVSQKVIPSPAVCRGLVESSRDTISTLRKAVTLLVKQLGAQGTTDPRYVRWLVLELYAITSELSCAWQAMAPEVEILKPFLYGSTFLNHSVLSSISSTYSDGSIPNVRLRSMDPSFGAGVGRTRTARRHAGSFSSKDVEIGKELPSYDLVPSMAGGLATHTPTLRTPKRQATLPILTTSTPSSSSFPYNPTYQTVHHSRHASQGSLLGSSSVVPLGSPALSTVSINNDVFHTIRRAVDISALVWDGLEESTHDTISGEDNQGSLSSMLEEARSMTQKLSHHLVEPSQIDDVDKRILREDVRSFLKVIIQLSSTLKSQGSLRSLPIAVRSNMLRLSKHAEELGALLHISANTSYTQSMSPLPQSRSLAYNTASQSPKDNQLGSSLSRSKNAQSTSNAHVKDSVSPPYDSARLGVAPLSINSSNKRRMQISRSASIDSGDAG